MKLLHPRLFIFILSYSGLSAQNVAFQETFTISNASTSAEAIVKTNDNGLVITGQTTVNQHAQTFLTKTNANGTIAWTKVYYDQQSHILIDNINDTEIFCNQLPKFLLLTSDDGFLVGGGIDSSVLITYPNGATSGSSFFRMFLIKTNGSGELMWTKKYSLNDFNGASDVSEDLVNGGFYVAAYAHQSGLVATDDLFMRLDPDGNVLWTKSFGGINSEGVSDLEKTSDGNLIMCGTSESFSNNQNIYVVKMDTSGNELWSKTYGTTGFDYGKSILQAPDGGFFVYGNAGNGSPGYVALIKTDATGNVIWSNTYGNSFADGPSSLVSDGNENLIAGVDHYSSSYDGLILLINSSGNTISNRAFGKSASDKNDFINSALPLPNGYLLAGSSNSFSINQFTYNGYLIKTDLNLFSACNNDSLNSDATPLALTVSPAATQISDEEVQSYPMLVSEMDSAFIQDTLCSSVFTNTLAIVPLYKSVSIFPNPATDRIEVTANTSINKISIYNFLGEEIFLSHPYKTSHETIAVSDFPNGTYLLVADTNTGSSLHRFSIVR